MARSGKFKWFLILIILVVVAGVAVTQLRDKGPKSFPPIAAGANESLVEHSKIFKKGVEKVTDGVYVAIGYGLANSIMIEGTDGLIIVDTMTTMEEGEAVLAEFRKISAKPVKAIIYTHNHADHVLGAGAFVGDGHPEIYAHDTLLYYVMRIVTEMRPITGTRALRMFGSLLDPKDVINDGIGPELGITPTSRTGFVPPTKTFSDTLDDEVSGVKFKLIHAPGETNDQIAVWLPEKQVLIPGDDFYWTFPNLYTIRGTPFRSLKNWYQSLDKLRDLNAQYLVPCHTRPVIGREAIQEDLTNYRDAIQFVHDQSIRGINMGLTPDELVEFVQLPPHLASAPYLQPFYGKVSWSVRAMFDGNLGWFNGDSATLQPLAPKEEARLMARLAGGEKQLQTQARELLKEGQTQAALELTTHLMQLNPADPETKDIRVQALTTLAEQDQNPNARHYYLTEAMEVRDGFVAKEESKPVPEFLHSLPLMGFLESMVVNLDPVATLETDQMVGLVFPDADEAFTIHIRHGVAELRRRTVDELKGMKLDILATADSKVFKEMLGRLRNPLVTIATFDYDPGNSLEFAKFMKLFTPAEMKLPCQPLPEPGA